MPFYEYRCEDCGKTFEHFARSVSDGAEECKFCGKRRLKKLISSFGFKSGSASSGDFHSSEGSSSCSTCTSSSCTECTG
jgi:putative FmdB family regulatory protein